MAYFFRWLLTSKEITNYTYDLSERNIHYLASLISDITQKEYDEIMGYIKEIQHDDALKTHVKRLTEQSEESVYSDKRAAFGKRMGWYALARAKKPKIIIETGVDKGLGSCVLAAALMRNASEGHEGYYYGTDINPKAGYLFCAPYTQFGEILYGDSIESLKKFDQKIDLFINDSDHSPDYEAQEYQVVAPKLAPNALILGDNAHATDKLFQFAQASNRQFLFFQENPLNHWYPGGGIGIAFERS